MFYASSPQNLIQVIHQFLCIFTETNKQGVRKRFLRIGLCLVLLIVNERIHAQQENDTIRLGANEILLLNDTIYYGHLDSFIILNKNTRYQIRENNFFREAQEDKQSAANDTATQLTNRFKKFIAEQIYATKEIIPKGFNPSDDYFKNYEGMIIKAIHYNQVKVLDGSVFDTTYVSTGLGRFLNQIHAPTKKRVLKNNTRFEINQPINSRVFSDNERILRNLPYVEEAKIYVLPITDNSDSVNILVVTKDKYPIGVSGELKDYNYFEVEPYTRNFLGLGHRIGTNIIYKGDADQKLGIGVSYLADNILGTFTNGEIGYVNSHLKENFYTRFEKPFVSTDTRYGGALSYEYLSSSRITSHYLPDSLWENEDQFSAQSFNAWLGYSVFLSRDITKPFLNFAARYFSDVYSKRPEVDPETNFFFHDKRTWLGAVSYQRVSFLETSKLFNFGTIEYVPEGFNLGATLGWQRTSFVERPYAGLHVNYSTLLKKKGILLFQTEAGGYNRKSKIEDGVINVNVHYLSPLLPLAGAEMRHLLSFSYNTNINPLYLNKFTFARDMHGLDNIEDFGNSTLLVKYQPVIYIPHELYGFNFTINPFVDLGWIDDSNWEIGQKNIHTVVGLGASVKNESLIFPALHVYAGYHPQSVAGQSRFMFEFVFRDYKILNFFAEFKPKTAHPENFYW